MKECDFHIFFLIGSIFYFYFTKDLRDVCAFEICIYHYSLRNLMLREVVNIVNLYI